MKGIMYKIKQWSARIYGFDKLSLHLLILCIVLQLCEIILDAPFIHLITFPIHLWIIFRCFSQNRPARYKELLAYQGMGTRLASRLRLTKTKWQQRSTHKYFKCRRCSAQLRVPRGKGSITVTCPRCGEKISKKT